MCRGRVMRGPLLYVFVLLLLGCSGGDGGDKTVGSDALDAATLADLPPQEMETGTEVLQDAVAEAAAEEDLPAAEELLEQDLTPGEDVAEILPWKPPFDPTVCGSEPHQWLPPDGMGAVVSATEATVSNVQPETLDEILEEAGYAHFGKAKYPARNFNVRYVTQDRGQLVEATAVVGVPMGEEVTWPAPIMVWLHGTTGFMDDCAPSANPFDSAAATALWASQGYVAVAPDYMGLRGFGESSPPGTIHSYLVGEATAISSLDAVRAALALLEEKPELGNADSQRIVLLGGSQGGHAAIFTDLYADHYAPELNIVAGVAAIGPLNLLGQANHAMSELVDGSANLLAALVAMRQWYGTPEDLMGLLTNEEPYFVADNIDGWLSESCHPDVDPTDVEEVSDVFLAEIVAVAQQGQLEQAEHWGCFLRENSIPGTSVPVLSDTPFLTSYASEDELLYTPAEKEKWPQLCELGYQLEYLECAGLGHVKGGLSILPYGRVWLEERLAGKPIDPEKMCVLAPPIDCETEL